LELNMEVAPYGLEPSTHFLPFDPRGNQASGPAWTSDSGSRPVTRAIGARSSRLPAPPVDEDEIGRTMAAAPKYGVEAVAFDD
jgi:hypothetical protein